LIVGLAGGLAEAAVGRSQVVVDIPAALPALAELIGQVAAGAFGVSHALPATLVMELFAHPMRPVSAYHPVCLMEQGVLLVLAHDPVRRVQAD
jgi:hypothetical protein